MFDVGFTEILVIMVVALIVIGPDRLPKVARSMGQWLGRVQRFINTVKQDVNRSMELEELRELERKVKAEADALERAAQQIDNDVGHGVRQLEKHIDSLPDSDAPTPPTPPTKAP
jgi:sec-independent protein translocase protein TatB